MGTLSNRRLPWPTAPLMTICIAGRVLILESAATVGGIALIPGWPVDGQSIVRFEAHRKGTSGSKLMMEVGLSRLGKSGWPTQQLILQAWILSHQASPRGRAGLQVFAHCEGEQDRRLSSYSSERQRELHHVCRMFFMRTRAVTEQLC